jgi:outer membrane protein assembly factor BamB
MRRTYPLLQLILVFGMTGCSDSAGTAPTIVGPVDHVEAIVTGRVRNPDGYPVEGARVTVSAICFLEPFQGCPSQSSSPTTDSEGRFMARFEIPLQSTHPVELQLVAVPPLGMGYVLGETTIENLGGIYQPPPVADTTFVQIVLPPNNVDSRRPVRVEPGGHLATLGADAERFYLSASGGVVALDPATGRCVWQLGGFGGRTGPQFTLVGGLLVIAGVESLLAVRAADGERIWNREGVPRRTLTVSESEGLYATDGHGVVAFDPRTGETLWRRELIGSGYVTIAASASLVCAQISAFVECWEPSRGELVWSRPTDFASWLAIAGERVILQSYAGWTALDEATGEIVWQAPIEEGIAPAVSGATDIVFACRARACFAVRTLDGQIAWRTTFDDVVGTPAVQGGSLYVKVGEAYGSTSLYVLDSASGRILERILPDPFDYGFCGIPALSSDYASIFGCGTWYTFERRW